MKKAEYLEELKKGLYGLPEEDIARTAEYYAELLDDRIEEGEDEETAVAAMPSIDEIRERALAEIPLVKLVGIKLKSKRRLSGLEILLLVVGFPIWFSLLAALFSVAISLYVALWGSAIVCVSLIAASAGVAIGGLIAGVAAGFGGAFSHSAICLGATLLGAGLSVFLFVASKWSIRGMLFLTKKMAIGVKKLFTKEKKV